MELCFRSFLPITQTEVTAQTQEKTTQTLKGQQSSKGGGAWSLEVHRTQLPILDSQPTLRTSEATPGLLFVSNLAEVRASLVVQWLGFCASTGGGPGSVPGQGTKILHAA